MGLPSRLPAGAAVSLPAACSGGNGSSSATASPAPSPAAPVDEGGNIQPYPGVESFLNFSDTSKINPLYATAVHEDESVRTTRNVARIWGTLKTFSPKKPVTRSEAAIAIWEINGGSAAVALGRSAPPPPK